MHFAYLYVISVIKLHSNMVGSVPPSLHCMWPTAPANTCQVFCLCNFSNCCFVIVKGLKCALQIMRLQFCRAKDVLSKS